MYIGIQITFDHKLLAAIWHNPRLEIYEIFIKYTLYEQS